MFVSSIKASFMLKKFNIVFASVLLPIFIFSERSKSLDILSSFLAWKETHSGSLVFIFTHIFILAINRTCLSTNDKECLIDSRCFRARWSFYFITKCKDNFFLLHVLSAQYFDLLISSSQYLSSHLFRVMLTVTNFVALMDNFHVNRISPAKNNNSILNSI